MAKIILLLIGIMIVISLAALTQADTNNYVVESEHNYTEHTDQTKRIDMGDATRIRLHFSKWELVSGDKVYIYDNENKIIARNGAGANGESYWSCDLYSKDYIEIRLMSHGGSAYGYCVDQVYTDSEEAPSKSDKISSLGSSPTSYKDKSGVTVHDLTYLSENQDSESQTSNTDSGVTINDESQTSQTSDSNKDDDQATTSDTQQKTDITPNSQDVTINTGSTTPEKTTDTSSNQVSGGSSGGSSGDGVSAAQKQWLYNQRKAAGKKVSEKLNVIHVKEAQNASDDVATLDQANTSQEQADPTASISMHVSQSNIQIGQSIPIDLSVVSFHNEPPRHCQIILVIPDGMSITSSELASYGAGQYGMNCELLADQFKDLRVDATANHQGDYDVVGKVRFTVDSDPNSKEYHELTTHIHVYVPDVAPEPQWQKDVNMMTSKLSYVAYGLFSLLILYIGILYVRGKLPI
jgi:hypothetical protein